MKPTRLYAAVATILVLVLGAACTAAQQPARTIDDAVGINVPITSTPVGAEIHIDGRLVGMTNAAFRLTPGEHRIEVSMPGYETWSRTVNVIRGTQIQVNLVRR